MQFATIEEAIAEIQEGRMVIIVDDEDRENEGDLMIAAEKVTPEAINFMATHGRGLICLPMTGERLDDLQIPLMVSDHSNTSLYGTAFCVSIEARRKNSASDACAGGVPVTGVRSLSICECSGSVCAHAWDA